LRLDLTVGRKTDDASDTHTQVAGEDPFLSSYSHTAAIHAV